MLSFELLNLRMKIEEIKFDLEHPNYHVSEDEIEMIDKMTEQFRTLASKDPEYVPTIQEQSDLQFNARLNLISKIIFRIGGFLDGWETYTIDLKAGIMHIEHWLEKGTDCKIDVDAFLKGLEKIHVGSWKDDYTTSPYTDVAEYDGTEWTLDIQYDDGFHWVYTGINCCPYNFTSFLKLIDLNK